MEIRHLRAFLALAEERTVTRAAGRLGITQPALTRILQDFQNEIGCSLLARVGRTLTLTAAGVALLAPVRAATASFDDVSAAAARQRNAEVLEIVASRSTLPLVSDAVGAMMRRLPDLRVHVTTADTHDRVVLAVRRGQAAIGFAPVHSVGSDLAYSFVRDAELVLISPPGTQLPGAIRVDRLERLPLVCLPPSVERYELFDRLFTNVAAAFEIVLENDDPSSFVQAVAAGIGSTLVWRDIADTLHGVEVRRFDPPLTRTVGFIHPVRPSRLAQQVLGHADGRRAAAPPGPGGDGRG